MIPPQYLAFEDSFRQLRKRAEELKPGIPQKWICSPGNHDCDFSKSGQFRNMILNSLNDPNTRLSNPEIVEECLKVQESYKEFTQRADFESPNKVHGGLVEEYFFRMADVNVCIRVYNTSWVSKLHEEPGKMSFPRSCMAEKEDWARGDLNVSVLHHPPHWLLPNRKRLMSQHLDRMSDLVMYGHEHLPEQFIKSDFVGNHSGILYGGVFQEDVHDVPGHLNVALYNTTDCTFKINDYERDGNQIIRASSIDKWIPIPRLAKTLGGRFEMSESHLEWLADADSDFSHPSGRKLSLEDLYVLPDFDEVSDDDFKTHAPRIISGDKLLEAVYAMGKLIIYGDERSGKTALGKFMFFRLMEKGITPLFMNSKDLGLSALKDLKGALEKTYNENYSTGSFSSYETLPKSQKALIVDDFHKIGLNSKGRVKFLQLITESFDTVICFGDRLMFLDEISEGVLIDHKTVGYSRYRMREMGRYSRRKLIRQWYSLGVEFSERGEVINQRVGHAESVVNSLFGKSFLPRLPVFVLGFLSNLDAIQQNKDIGTYGYIYESSITNSLARGGSKVQMDIKYRFLSEVAYYMHRSNRSSISLVDLRALYRIFTDKIGRDPGFELLTNEVFVPGILVYHDDDLRFQYSFADYFFIARYYRDHLSKTEIRDELKGLASALHIEKNSNIWLFLVHQSKDEFLLDCVLNIASNVFRESPLAKLEKDIDFIREIQVELSGSLHIPSGQSEDTIKEIYDSADHREDNSKTIESNQFDDSEGGVQDFIREVEVMIRTVVVLGQLVKNFPALDADYKFSLVRGAFETSLRGLNAVLNKIRDGEEGLAKIIAEKISEKSAGLPRVELEGAVKASLFWIYEANVFGLVRLVSGAVGAIGEESTYKKVVTEIDSIAGKLIGVSIGLHTLRIPRNEILELKDELKGDLFNQHILRGLVANHLYLFPVPQGARQEICDKLNIVIGDSEKRERALGYRHGKK
jgi:hypothetical protein